MISTLYIQIYTGPSGLGPFTRQTKIEQIFFEAIQTDLIVCVHRRPSWTYQSIQRQI